jgi:putative peptidoglycan lipid II flippase
MVARGRRPPQEPGPRVPATRIPFDTGSNGDTGLYDDSVGRLQAVSRSRWVGPLDLAGPAWNPLIPNIVIGTTGVFAQGSLRFIYSIVIAASLSASVLGHVNSLISLAMLASMLWPTAAGFAATKYLGVARGSGDVDRVTAVTSLLRRRVLWTAVPLAGAVAVLAVVVVDASAAQAAQTAGLVLAYSLYIFVRGVVYGVQQIPRATLWDVATAALALAGLAIVVVIDEPGVLLLPLTLSYALYAAVNWPRSPSRPVDDADRREIDRFVAYAVVGVLASAGLPQVAIVVAHSAIGSSHTGQLAAALSLATPSAMLANAATLVMSPALAHMLGRGDESSVRHHLDHATRGLVAVMVAVFGSLVLVSPLLVELFYPGSYEEAARLLPVVLIAVLIPTIASAAITYLLVIRVRGQQLFAAANLLGFLLGVAAMAVLLTLRPDARSVAWAYLLGSVVVGVVPLAAVWRSTVVHWTGLTLRLVAGGALLAACHAVIGSMDGSAGSQLGGVLVFLAGWAIICRRDLRSALAEVTGRGIVSSSPRPGLDAPSSEAPRT